VDNLFFASTFDEAAEMAILLAKEPSQSAEELESGPASPRSSGACQLAPPLGHDIRTFQWSGRMAARMPLRDASME
jgi:hypothetical protein